MYELSRPVLIYLILKANVVTGWSPCRDFAMSCAGVGETVVGVGERGVL